MSPIESPRLAAFVRRARDFLESPRVPAWAAVVAALLTSTSLPGGLATEDWVLSAGARSPEFSFPRRVNLFGPDHPLSPAELARRFEQFRLAGFWPWSVDPRLDVSFFRPVSSLTHLVDFRLLGAHPWLMHLENVAWYAALAAAVAVLYRRLATPSWLAGAAALLYAADDAHGHAVGWLINRNALMAGVFGVLSLLSYDAFRRKRSVLAAVACAGALALALLSAEYGLSVAGYLAAYTLVLHPGTWRARLADATIWVVTIAAWAVLYRYLGHGVRASGLYVDPLSSPAEYVSDLLERASLLLTGQLGAPFSDVFSRTSLARQGFLTLWAVTFLWLLGWVLVPVLRADRNTRFWTLGMLLSLPPSCSTFPEDRLLFFAGIGAMPVVVQLVAHAFRTRAERGPRRLPTLALGLALLALHGAVGPVLLPFRSVYMTRYEARLRRASDTAFAGTTPPSTLVLLNGEDFYFTGMMCQSRAARRESMPARALVLAGTADPVEVRREDESTLVVSPRNGFVSREFNRIYRSRAHALARGEHVNLLGIDVTVLERDVSGDPLSARFRFAVPLDAPGYVFREWDARAGEYRPFRLPAVGSTVVVGGET